jgi:hypothetical protein
LVAAAMGQVEFCGITRRRSTASDRPTAIHTKRYPRSPPHCAKGKGRMMGRRCCILMLSLCTCTAQPAPHKVCRSICKQCCECDHGTPSTSPVLRRDCLRQCRQSLRKWDDWTRCDQTCCHRHGRALSSSSERLTSHTAPYVNNTYAAITKFIRHQCGWRLVGV